MKKSIEKLFEQLADEIVGKAESVECSLEDFSEGMKIIASIARTRAEMADEEIRFKNK